MTVLLMRISGVPMLERGLLKRRPDYAAYVARTSAFVPMLPRRVPLSAQRGDGSAASPRP